MILFLFENNLDAENAWKSNIYKINILYSLTIQFVVNSILEAVN